MQGAKCSVDNIDLVLDEEILEPFKRDVTQALAAGIDDAAKELVKLTKATAPRSRLSRSGSFAKHIAWKSENGPLGSHRAIWYVKAPDYRLTHLIVHGHATRDGGRTKANPFLEDALEAVEPKLQANIEKRMKP